MSKKKAKIKINKEINKTIPNDIKVLFGKFYLFSFIYIVLFGILYPLLLVNILTMLSSIILFVLLIIFYIYMIIDVYKKKKNYSSTMYVLLILLVIMSISFSIVKFIV